MVFSGEFSEKVVLNNSLIFLGETDFVYLNMLNVLLSAWIEVIKILKFKSLDSVFYYLHDFKWVAYLFVLEILIFKILGKGENEPGSTGGPSSDQFVRVGLQVFILLISPTRPFFRSDPSWIKALSFLTRFLTFYILIDWTYGIDLGIRILNQSRLPNSGTRLPNSSES